MRFRGLYEGKSAPSLVSSKGEDAEQKALVKHLRLHRIAVMSVPNEGKRSVAGHRRMEALGRLKGAPDLVLLTLAPKDGLPVAIEMKGGGGSVAPAQKKAHATMRAEGWHVAVCWSCREAVEFLRGLGYPLGRCQ